MGLWAGDTSPVMYLYKYHKSKSLLQIPIGLYDEVRGFLDPRHLKYLVDLSDMEKADINAKIPLYDYQEKAVNEMIKARYGILQSKAGSGKTQMGIALACRLGYRTLLLTHTQDLLKQSYNRALQYLSKEKLGKITEGKVELGEITFATVQTMCKLNLHNYKYCFNNVAYKVPDTAVSDKVMTVKVKKVDTGITYDDIKGCYDTDGTLIYSKFLTSLGECQKRNEIIKGIVNNLNDRQVLILSDRVGHLRLLKDMLNGAELLVGSTNAKEREQIINNAKAGKVKVILSTFALAKEGLDIPCLTDLIMATPVKDFAIVVQAVGRVARVAKDKPQPVVYDLVDDINKCHKMFLQRVRHYKRSGCVICQ